jgi:hypothetical protein
MPNERRRFLHVNLSGGLAFLQLELGGLSHRSSNAHMLPESGSWLSSCVLLWLILFIRCPVTEETQSTFGPAIYAYSPT